MGNFKGNQDFVTTASSVAGGDTGLSHAIYVGEGGNLEVVPYGQTTSVIFVGVPAGTFLPVVVSEVKSAGTTALSLIKCK
jgi:hypothetical protein